MIAIHHRPGSFSDHWITYCEKQGIAYKLVCCFDSDIIDQLKDVDGLMWHWAHWDHKAVLFARQLIYSLEEMGIKVFPNSKTCWHYDDKVGQKYLLESIDAPLVPSFVFYEKDKALQWAAETSYPKVSKTRNGAGAQNVRLVKSFARAKRLIKKSFGKGIRAYDKKAALKESLWLLRKDRSLYSVGRVLKYSFKFFLPAGFQVKHTIEKDYVYFQDFIPGNKSDTRIYIIGDKALATIRYNREGDFRASGSGLKSYDPELVNMDAVKIAFDVSDKLKLQSCAYDFVMDNGTPVIVEISYCFGTRSSTGFWDRDLNWNEEKTRPENMMVEDFVKSVSK